MSMQPDDLVAFIEARLRDDQEAAEAIDVPDWRSESSWMSELINPLPSQRRAYDGQFPLITAEDVEHIARHDPARVLREVQAKRRLLDAIFRYEAKIDGEWGCCHSAEEIRAGACSEVDEVEALTLLAQPYSDHPDFRPEWSPTA